MAEKKPPRAFQEEQGFLTAVLEQVEDAIVACNSEGALTLFNRAAREIHGLPEKPIPPQEWAEYYDLYLPDGVTRMNVGDVPLFRALQGEHVHDVEMVIAPKHSAART
ncbi:MAG TPA: PAS domain-containing protein, partial [Abditibacteriaceae bacterium]